MEPPPSGMRVWMNLEGIVSKRIGSRYVSERTRMAENEESEFRGAMNCRLGRRPEVDADSPRRAIAKC